MRWSCGVTSGGGVDEEGLGAAEGDVGVEGEVLAGNQAQGGIAASEFGDGDPGFQFAQVGAQAVVQALTESQVSIGTRSVHIELVGVVERFLVAAGGGQPQEKF